MAVLSAASVIQAKTGQITTTPGTGEVAPVSLDAGTQAGSTVTIELTSQGVSFTDGTYQNHLPDGWDIDGVGLLLGVKGIYVLRKPGVAAGEGIAGSTPWNFDSGTLGLSWSWRVTEWNADLEPISPLSGVSPGNDASGAAVTSLSTGITNSTDRGDLVLLATHYWQNATGSNPTFSFASYDNSFTKRDELRWAAGGSQYDAAWAWRFAAAAGTYECTATISNSIPHVNDVFCALLVAYASTVG